MHTIVYIRHLVKNAGTDMTFQLKARLRGFSFWWFPHLHGHTKELLYVVVILACTLNSFESQGVNDIHRSP